MDPLNMVTYDGSTFVHPDQCATPAHERHQLREPRLNSPWHLTSVPGSSPTPPSGPQRSTSPSPFITSDTPPDASSPNAERVRRPRNAFMIFRSEFNSTRDKISRNVEHDNRLISRISGHVWNQMSEEEKDVWRKKADNEKLEHMRKHPGYKFTPLARTKKIKRNVKRNGEDEMERCRLVADLLLEGKQGDELATALKASDPRNTSPKVEEEMPLILTPPRTEERPYEYFAPTATIDMPAFKSPLFPPHVEAEANIPPTPISSMGANPAVGAGANLVQRHDMAQWPYPHDPRTPERREFPRNQLTIHSTPPRHHSGRSDWGPYTVDELPAGINSPTSPMPIRLGSSPYSPQSPSYPMTPPTKLGHPRNYPRIRDPVPVPHYSRYDVNDPWQMSSSSPESPSYRIIAQDDSKRRELTGRRDITGAAPLTFRDPFVDHQRREAYAHCYSPPTSPTDMRRFRGDQPIPRRSHGGQ